MMTDRSKTTKPLIKEVADLRRQVATLASSRTRFEQIVEARKREKEIIQTVLDSINDPISVIDLDSHRIVAANKAFLNLVEHGREEVIGQPCYQVNHHRTEPCSNGEHPCPVALTIESGRDFTIEHVYLRHDGEEITLEMSTTAIADRTGRVVQVVQVSRDMTERKRSEEELARLSRELQETNVALKVLLKQRDEDKQLLEDRVWHNIKKMILPHLNTLRQSGLSPEQAAYADLVAHRLEDITSGLGRGLSKYGLTPREIEVAGHILEGKTSKDIAKLICLSPKSVEVYRHGLRQKLGLVGKRINLRSQLMSLTQ